MRSIGSRSGNGRLGLIDRPERPATEGLWFVAGFCEAEPATEDRPRRGQLQRDFDMSMASAAPVFCSPKRPWPPPWGGDGRGRLTNQHNKHIYTSERIARDDFTPVAGDECPENHEVDRLLEELDRAVTHEDVEAPRKVTPQ